MALSIKWHRLVVDGDTCERCGLTEEEVEDAAEKLGKVLVLLGVNVELDKKEISREKFEEDPAASNAVFIDGDSFRRVAGWRYWGK